jgi:hypothetical protein
VDHASHAHAQLHKDFADAEVEFSTFFFAMGKSPISLLCVYLLDNLIEVASELEITR